MAKTKNAPEEKGEKADILCKTDIVGDLDEITLALGPQPTVGAGHCLLKGGKRER